MLLYAASPLFNERPIEIGNELIGYAFMIESVGMMRLKLPRHLLMSTVRMVMGHMV